MLEKVKAKCIDYTHDGRGVVKINKMPVFVPDLLVGEEAEITIVRQDKNYAIGRRGELIVQSKNRVVPICPVYKECGGCQLQHLDYQEQLRMKNNRLEQALRRIGGVNPTMLPIIGMENPYFYRNKVQVPYGLDRNNDIIAGFFKRGTHEIVDTKKCYIENEESDEIIIYLKTLFKKYEIKPYEIDQDKGVIKTVLVKKATSTNQIMVVIVTRSTAIPHMNELLRDLTIKFTNIKTIIHNVSNIKTTKMLGDKENILFGPGYIEDVLMGVKFQISARSFYQVNPTQTKFLYEKAIEFADFKGNEMVLDAYCGIGTIALIMAHKVKKVLGIDIVGKAIEDANNNAKINNIKNVDFVAADVNHYVAKLEASNQKLDVVVVDPPRDGLDQKFINLLLKSKPSKIVYISCEPSSLARDIKQLSRYYNLEKVQGVDMFPQTYHVESVVLLKVKS
jgi:23S rRNA (uracil1939-C5)-methyltransferase